MESNQTTPLALMKSIYREGRGGVLFFLSSFSFFFGCTEKWSYNPDEYDRVTNFFGSVQKKGEKETKKKKKRDGS